MKRDMNNAQIKLLILFVVSLILSFSASHACRCTEISTASQTAPADANQLESILTELKQRTTNLQFYQAQVEYIFRQPLLESKTLRKGILYYARFDKKSRLRLNFTTLKQDDEKEQKYLEHFIFDGIWLTHIDYQIKSVQRRQLAEPNEPVDAFDLASRNLPIVGFAKVENLRKQFEIDLVSQKSTEQTPTIQLHLKTKANSVYRDDYTFIDFWIDRKTMLPAKVIAVTTEEDVYEIKLLQPKVNQKIDKEIFDFKIPGGFGEPEIIPLKQNKVQK
jgi:outer membrane lipoprotein-sorting protein